MVTAPEEDETQPASPAPSAEPSHASKPTHSEMTLWSYLPAVLIDIAVTVAIFLVSQGALFLTRSYLTSTPAFLLPIAQSAAMPYTPYLAMRTFLALWLIASLVAILLRHTIDILRTRRSGSSGQ